MAILPQLARIPKIIPFAHLWSEEISDLLYLRLHSGGVQHCWEEDIDIYVFRISDYFYEIVNRSGKSVFIQLALSSRNATEDFMDMCDRINEYYPSKVQKADWQWRTPFKTSTVEIAEDLSKEAIFAGLDECLKEIQTFENDLKQKLGM